MTEPRDAGWEVDTAPVEALLQSLLKALRAAQLYLPNNPVYQTAMDNARKAFPPVWELTDELQLTVLENELKWEGKVVLSQPRNEAFAWILFKDGVRGIRLQRGAQDGSWCACSRPSTRPGTFPPRRRTTCSPCSGSRTSSSSSTMADSSGDGRTTPSE